MSLKLNTLLCLLTFVFSTSLSFSRGNIARVVKIRGKVTLLKPGGLSAIKVQLNDKLTEDASLVTYRRSFIRIMFDDGSTVSLGPKSKIIVTKMNKNGKGILTLLKGQLRSKIIGTDKKRKGHKFLVKTRTAALGVRGTEFQTIFNPENNITNLLTYKGEVAMAKIETTPVTSASYDKSALKLGSHELSKTKKIQIKAKLNESMEAALKSKETVVVKSGQFSGALDSVEKATLPVNISPVQLNSLYANTELVQKSKTKVTLSDLKDVKEKGSDLKTIKQEAPPEGVNDNVTGDFAQKSGGFIDIGTGLYIPPEQSSVFSQDKNIYLAENVGNFDVQTGQYIAPEGLTLSAKQGFIIAKTSRMSNEEVKDKKEKAKTLNNVIDKNIVLKKKKKRKKSVHYYNQLELISKDALSIELHSFNYEIKHKDSTTTGPGIMDSDGKGFKLNWDHSSGGKWQPTTYLSYDEIRFDGQELAQFSQSSKSLFGMGVGVRKHFSQRLNFLALLSLDQIFIPGSSTDTSGFMSFDLRRVTIASLELGAQWFYAKSRRYDLDLEGGVLFNNSKTAKDLKVKPSLGLKLGTGFRYWFKKDLWLKLAFDVKANTYKVKSTNYSATEDITRSSIGLEFGIVL
ncbi:hypothetical protein A9Q84_12950 [Halobacteriovorax marinus]|uniref:FecR protein domain-containing protein n=1 Tax=Halobacteriovorax marinus TaxID=97084 RepID=A0A1Y5F8K2_9BACT|nr:hypothetical protein A9Q84_12950 [Halobacteriovorax marinus]